MNLPQILFATATAAPAAASATAVPTALLPADGFPEVRSMIECLPPIRSPHHVVRK